IRHLLENGNFFRSTGNAAERFVQLADDIVAFRGFDREEPVDLIDLIRRQSKTNLLSPDLLELIDHAENINRSFLSDGCKSQQQIQNAPAGKANLIVGYAERSEEHTSELQSP